MKFIHSTLNLFCFVVFPFLLHSQSDTLTKYRIFGSQNFKIQVGSNLNLNDSLENEILNIDLNADKYEYYFDLKFHVIESGKVINDDIISNQLEILNKSFQTIDYEHFLDNENLLPFYQLSANPNFNFCNTLSSSYYNIETEFANDKFLKDNLIKISPIVQGKKVINIYIVDFAEVAGVSTPPNLKDGFEAIIIDKKYFGINRENVEGYNQGKTLVHLMASFLGLHELWNEYAPCSDDKVADTPIHNYANFSAGSLFKNISTCEGNEVEMIVNYMDNLPDEFCTMFTQGQVDRMKKVALAKYGRRNYNFMDCNQLRNRNNISDDITLYPNPNTGDFSISTQQTLEEVEIKIYNFLGTEIFNKHYKKIEEGSSIDINLQNVESGIHALRIFTQNKLMKQISFVKY